MTRGGSGGADDDDHGSNQTMKDVWLAAQNLSIGDEVMLNWEFVFEVKRINQDDSIIEYLGKVRNEDDEWRVLRVNSESMGSLGLFPPEMTERIGVINIAPVGETILAAKTATSLLFPDVTGEDTHDSYVDERDPDVEFSNDVDIVGECPCGGDIGIVGPKVLCEACGRWVPAEIWHAWSEDSSTESDDESTTDSVSERDNSENRSLEDFS